jgi:hypothetical protein
MHRPTFMMRALLSLWLVLSLSAAPLAPAFAAVAPGDSHATHAEVGMAAMHADHAVAGQDTAGHPDSSCAQHDRCNGKCCAACAQCFTAALGAAVSPNRLHPVQTPVVPRLHDRLVAAGHNRPPSV